MQVQKACGKTPKELEYDELSSEICYIWQWFIELHNARPSSGFSASPIGFNEIKAWSELTGWILESWEVSAIRLIDQEFVKFQAENSKKD